MKNTMPNNFKKEKSLLEIINIVYRGRIIIVISVILALVLALLYIKFTPPVYESKALLKKEAAENPGQRDEFSELVKLQTSDQLETEMELIKTNEVLSGVINELKLYVELKKIVDPNGNSFEFNNIFVDFPDSANNYTKQMSFRFPVFRNFQLLNDYTEIEYYIKKISQNRFELWNDKENKLITSFNDFSVSESDSVKEYNNSDLSDSTHSSEQDTKGMMVITDAAKFEFSWTDAPIGSKIYFNIKNYLKFLISFGDGINVSRVGHTGVFELNVRSVSPLACNVIANSIIRHFREVRMEQQKQMVRYSFHFVDQQLSEVEKKLLDAENNLSSFKGSQQIMSIDQNTQELLNYQSTLEAENLQTDLLLSDYRNKEAALKNELESSGYYDQGLLTPSPESPSSSPITTLMSRLSDLELQRLELLQKRTEKHPDVIKLDEQIRLTKEQLSSYNQNTLASYRIVIDAMEKKQAKINSLMSGFETQIRKLPGQESQLARLIREKEVFEKIYNVLLNKREEMRVAELSKLQDIIIVDYPSSPFKPVLPKKLFTLMMAVFLGGFVGIVLIFIGELRKTRLVNLDDLENEFNMPILALIPSFDKSIRNKMKKSNDKKDKFVMLHTDTSGISESYRLLNTKLSRLDLKDKTIMVTSCEENTGKTTIVANLAITMALNNKNVLIIDCDLRKGELSKMFNVFDNSSGLIDFLEKGNSPVIYNKILKKINIIPSGGLSENSSVLLSSDRMKSMFEKINTTAYDFIIIDTPPVTRVVDTLVLGQYISNAILIVRPDTSVKDSVIGGIQDLKQAQVKLLGIVANATDIQNSYRYRYSYGYGYGYGSSQENKGSGHIVKKVSSIVRKKSKANSY
ncbi:MAG: polysaccharide biosynthesis tyrosine autokinase [Ignavibacteriaceae bacterium]|jgi:capsular exopolysaccharide synthesis family protein|nr:polysaccharide biosynthesis tyrosine autokinase [Ignavibacteriaceae bacterium]